MLDTPTRHRAPYPLFTVEGAFSEERCVGLEALFDADVPWARHDDELYECFIADVTDRVDRTWLGKLSRRMVEHTGLDLTQKVQVTIQRMAPGDHVGVHSDRPLLGYEAVRLVLQLDRDWSAEDGGLFRAFDGDRTILETFPLHNRAVGLALTEASLHEVTCVRRERRSVVFNFWHPGNTDAVKALVHGLFADISFGDLPDSVAELADAAEAELPESDTHRAASVALALIAWGYDDDEAATGYTLALSDDVDPVHGVEVAVVLARWLHRLHVESFDVDAWRNVERQLAPKFETERPRTRDTWRAAFGRGQ